MKNLLILITIMLVGGCGKDEATEPANKSSSHSPSKITKPVRKLTEEEEKVVGAYELKDHLGRTFKFILHKNGKSERSANVVTIIDFGTWETVPKSKSESKQKEVHVIIGEEAKIHKIEPNGDLTLIAEIWEGQKRKDLPKDEQLYTYKKIK